MLDVKAAVGPWPVTVAYGVKSRVGDGARGSKLLLALFCRKGETMTEDRANDLINKGLEAERDGDYDASSEYYRQALSIYRQEIRKYAQTALTSQITRNRIAFERSVMLIGWLEDYTAFFDLWDEAKHASLSLEFKQNLLRRMNMIIENEIGRISFHVKRGEQWKTE